MNIKPHGEKLKIERPGREIKIDNSIIGNKNVTIRIGTTDNKNCPSTVYITVSFWVDIKNRNKKNQFDNYSDYISKVYLKEIKKLKSHTLKEILTDNKYFPYYFDNIFTFDFPENINYNEKKSFTTLELTLHTLNCNKNIIDNNPYPLKNVKESKLYVELLKIAKVICKTDLLKSKLDFQIYKSKN